MVDALFGFIVELLRLLLQLLESSLGICIDGILGDLALRAISAKAHGRCRMSAQEVGRCGSCSRGAYKVELLFKGLRHLHGSVSQRVLRRH